MSRSTPRRLTRTLIASAALVAGVLAAAPAHADEASDAPVTADDTVSVDTGGFAELRVLKNDTDPNGDELAICRVSVADDVPLFAEVQGDSLFIGDMAGKAGTYEITYYACDFDYLTPATVTVHVVKVKPIKATKISGHPGRVKFSNPGDRKVTVLFGGRGEENPDGRVGVPAHSSKAITTKRKNLFYIAFVSSTGSIAGYGTVHNVAQPKKTAAERPSVAPFSKQEYRVWRSAV